MKIVPDSNITLALVLPLPYTSAALVKMQQWQRENAELIVPTLSYCQKPRFLVSQKPGFLKKPGFLTAL